jgi:hypothetical protein
LVDPPWPVVATRCRIVYRIGPIVQAELLPEDDHLEGDERLRAGKSRDGGDEDEDRVKPLHVRSEGSKDGDAILVFETPTFKRG